MTKETINRILKFRDDRDWKQFHNLKDLAKGVSLVNGCAGTGKTVLAISVLSIH